MHTIIQMLDPGCQWLYHRMLPLLVKTISSEFPVWCIAESTGKPLTMMECATSRMACVIRSNFTLFHDTLISCAESL